MWLTKAHTSQEAPTSISGSSSRMINECDEIALATSIHDMPNVRIVNYYYDQDNNIMYFATYIGREKISEFWKNNNVAFTTKR